MGGMGKVMVGKWRQLYLNNNFKKSMFFYNCIMTNVKKNQLLFSGLMCKEHGSCYCSPHEEKAKEVENQLFLDLSEN